VRNSRGLLILLVIVVAVAAALWLWTRPEPEPVRVDTETTEIVRFRHVGVSVRSPDLEVGSADVRGAIHTDYTSWRIAVDCGEADGCAGEFAVEVSYTTAGGDGRIVLVNRCDTPVGGTMVFEGLQNVPTTVESIDLVRLEVRSRGTAGGVVEVPL
jgi:hypothetical protein